MRIPHPFSSVGLSHLGLSSVSVIRFPPCLSGYFLRGSVDDAPEFLFIFSNVAITFTHSSSFFGQMLSACCFLYAEKQCISAALLYGQLSSNLLRNFFHERDHIIRDLCSNALIILLRKNEPSRQATRLGISDRAFFGSIPPHPKDWFIVPFPKGQKLTYRNKLVVVMCRVAISIEKVPVS